MLGKILFVLALASSSVYATYSDCGSETGELIDIRVSGCDNAAAKCMLKRNTNATISLTFKSNVESASLASVVHGVVLGVPIKFNLPQPDGCIDSGITCPVQSGTQYTYQSTLPVRENYPRVTVDVKWELQDSNGKDVVCVLIPSKIK